MTSILTKGEWAVSGIERQEGKQRRGRAGKVREGKGRKGMIK